MEVQFNKEWKNTLYVSWLIVPFLYVPLDILQNETSLSLCSYPVTLDSVDQYQAKPIGNNIDGWFEIRKIMSPSFHQQWGKGKENSDLRLAHKSAYMWFPVSHKRCWFLSYQEIMWYEVRVLHLYHRIYGSGNAVERLLIEALGKHLFGDVGCTLLISLLTVLFCLSGSLMILLHWLKTICFLCFRGYP